jgi:hypothetical protein
MVLPYDTVSDERRLHFPGQGFQNLRIAAAIGILRQVSQGANPMGEVAFQELRTRASYGFRSALPAASQ